MGSESTGVASSAARHGRVSSETVKIRILHEERVYLERDWRLLRSRPGFRAVPARRVVRRSIRRQRELQKTRQIAAHKKKKTGVESEFLLTMFRDEKALSVEAAIDGDVQDVPEVPKIVALLLARRQLFQDGLDRATVLRVPAWLGAALEEETDDGEPKLVFTRDEQRLREERDA